MRRAPAVLVTLILGWSVAVAAQLGGSWCTDIAIAPQSGAVTSLTSTVIVDWLTGGWTFESRSGLSLTGWTTQQFTAGGLLGELRITSALLFNPQAASFTSWTAGGSLPFEGLTLTGLFLVGPGGSGWTFGGLGAVGDVTADATIYLNMDSGGGLVRQTDCSVCWDGLRAHLCFPLACLRQTCATLNLDAAGFKDIQFCTTGIPFPLIDWISLGVCADFTLTTKSVSLTPTLNVPTGCITFYTTIGTDATAGLSIASFTIYGIGFTSTLGSVTVTDVSSLNPAQNATLTGYSQYWEKLRLSSSGSECCGALNLDVSVWFSASGGQLFQFGQTAISVSVGLATNFSFTTGVTITTAGLDEWDLGFCLKW